MATTCPAVSDRRTAPGAGARARTAGGSPAVGGAGSVPEG